MKKILSVLILTIAFSVHGQSFKKLSLEEQLEDIEFIQSELQKLHPGIYTYQTQEEFEDGFTSLKTELQEKQTVFDFYNNLVPRINNVGCGHTTSKIPQKELKKIKKNRKFLPLAIKIIDNKIFIEEVISESENLFPGQEIISLDGMSALDYIQSNLSRYPSDGRIMSRKYQALEKNFSIDYSTYYYTSKTFKIEVDKNGERTTFTIEGIGYQDFISKRNLPKLADMEFQTIDSISTGILTIRNSKSKKVFDAFLEQSFSEIRQQKIDNLIIDVRYDSFNRDSDGAALFSYLTAEAFGYYDKLEVTKNYDVPKAIRWLARYPIEQDSTGKYYWTIHPQLEEQLPQPNPFLGKVFVLVDGFTFSATSEFSSQIKSRKRGKIIGRETGGSYYGNNSGGMLRKVLPNSKIIVYIPPIHYRLDVNDLGNYDRGVIPDIPVENTVSNLILKEDLIKKNALDLILEEHN